MKVSIVIPSHNEEKRIRNTLEEYTKFFDKNLKENYEILVILNACTDKTLEIVKDISKRKKSVKYKNLKNAGKGLAIMDGFKEALKHKTELIGFVDADMATSPEAFNDLIKNIDGYEGIIASRYEEGAIVKSKQKFMRIIASRVFNFLVRVWFFLPYKDTQCGAKLFKKPALNKIISHVTTTNWAFDVDLLYKSKKFGFAIKEQPTIWDDKKDSKLNLKKASIQMFFAVLRLRLLNSQIRKIWWIFRPFSGLVWRLVK